MKRRIHLNQFSVTDSLKRRLLAIAVIAAVFGGDAFTGSRSNHGHAEEAQVRQTEDPAPGPAAEEARDGAHPDETAGAGDTPEPTEAERLALELESDDLKTRREAALQLYALKERALPALDALVKALGAGDQQVWFHSVRAITGIGADAAPAIPTLVEALASGNEQVRYRSAYALGAIGGAAVPKLLAALGDAHAGKRLGAVEALGWIGADAAPAVDALVKSLADSDARVREETPRSLGKVGTAAVAALHVTVERILSAEAAHRPPSDTARADAIKVHTSEENAQGEKTDSGGAAAESLHLAVRALGLIGAPALSASEVIRAAGSYPSAVVRAEATTALRRVGVDAVHLVPFLTALLADEAKRVRRAAAYNLLALPREIVIPAVDAVLQGENQLAVDAAAHVVIRIGPAARMTVPHLLDALLRFDATPVSDSLTEALISMGNAAVPTILAAFDDPRVADVSSRRLSAALAGATGQIDAATLKLFAAKLDGGSASTKSGVAEAVARLGRQAAALGPNLEALLVSNAAPASNAAEAKLRYQTATELRAAAARALAAIDWQGAAALAQLRGMVGDQSANVRAAALEALSQLDDDRRSLTSALVQGLDDDDERVQAAAISGLQSTGDVVAEAVPGLIRIFEDDSRARDLRVAACAALRTAGSATRPAVEPLIALATVASPRSAAEADGSSSQKNDNDSKKAQREVPAARPPDEEVTDLQKAAIETLAALTDVAGADAVHVFIATLNHTSETMQLVGAEALARLGTIASAAVPALEAATRADDAHPRSTKVRIAALDAIARVVDDEARQIAIFSAAVGDQMETVRIKAITLLGELGPAARGAGPLLFERLNDRYERRFALEALGKIKPTSVPLLLKLLSRDERFAKVFAAEQLGGLGHRAAEALAPLRELNAATDQARVRRATGEAVAKIEAAVDAIRSTEKANTHDWNVGVATVEITPTEPIWMAGYAARRKPAQGKTHELFAKAIALEDKAGTRLVIVTLDLIGVSREFTRTIAATAERRYRLPRASLLLSASHTHCGPELRVDKLPLLDLKSEEAEKLEVYGRNLEQKVVALIGNALAEMEPANLQIARGSADFARNRRFPTPSGFINRRYDDGRVDHDVPVLTINGVNDEARAVLFGYACHNTTLSFYNWCGDYAGFAQRAIEASHPGAIALFVTGCGGDQNPYPRGTLELAKEHGANLANAVTAAMRGATMSLRAPLRVAFEEVSLDFQKLPPRAAIAAMLESRNVYQRRKAAYLLERLEEPDALPSSYPCPVQVLRFGDELLFVALGGEAVVDYAHRIKREFDAPAVWVSAYANDVFGYLPSRRVLREGGYEAGGAMLYGPLPGPFTDTVEERVIDAVHRLVRSTAKSTAAETASRSIQE